MLGNVIVVIGLAALQVRVLLGAVGPARRGLRRHRLRHGLVHRRTLLFTIVHVRVAETLASKVGKQEEYIGATPALAILPFFFAGALYPISAMPGALTTIAKFMPLTHALR